jgi:ABC-type transport system involved in multi-copper enzyme maturation permease subunit
MKLWALITDTFREIYAKKVILAIIIVEVAALIITALVLFSSGMQSIFRGAREMNTAVIQRDSATTKSIPAPATAKDSAEAEITESLLNDTTGEAAAVADSIIRRDSQAAATRGGTDSGKHWSATFSTKVPPEIARNGLRTPGEVMLEEHVINPLTFYGAAIFAATIFLGIFATAGIVPSMMEKGTIDLLLSKPLRRSTLFAGRALGGAIAVVVNLIFFAAAVWALFGFASGFWYMPFLIYTVLIATFGYLTVYAGILLMNVLSESWVLPLTIAYAHVIILSPLLASRESGIYLVVQNSFLRGLIEGLHYVLPQTHDLELNVIGDAIAHQWLSTYEPFIQGAIFMAVTIGIAVWRFDRKDF